jgi:aspartate kinase
MVIVSKFGGGILKDEENFEAAAKIIRSKKEHTVVVVSAANGVTDSIIEALHSASKGTFDVDLFTEDLAKKHESLIKHIENPKIRESAVSRIREKAATLNKLLCGVLFLREASPRVNDLAMSFGERLSGIVFEAHLLDSGINAKAFEADRIGILTTDRFGKAKPLLEETRLNLERTIIPFLSKGTAVVTGFFGADEHGNVTTFGRGGSDFSAGIIANVLDAERLEIWKDVPGFMSADPRIVPQAKKIDMLSYDEAEELGYFGAKILHPKTIAPMRSKNIPIVIKSILEPSSDGTQISEKRHKMTQVAKSVAVKMNVSMLTVKGAEVLDMTQTIPFLSKLAEYDISLDAVSTSETGMSLVFDKNDVHKVKNALKHFPSAEGIEFEEDVSLVGLIGEGMKSEPGISGRLFRSIGDAGVSIRMISQGASEINISFVIKRKDVNVALNAIHAEFME